MDHANHHHNFRVTSAPWNLLDKHVVSTYILNNRLTSQFIISLEADLSPRPDVSDERKNQILQAATNVFSRLGFHKARMDDIVEESGLSKGTLYWYFKSKDDIVSALIAARDPETGAAFTRDELIDQIGVFFLAGHETTASVLTWVFFVLAMRPDVARLVRDEVEAEDLDPARAEDRPQLAEPRAVGAEAEAEVEAETETDG